MLKQIQSTLCSTDTSHGPAGRGDPHVEAGDARQEGGGEGQAGGARRPRQAGGGETQCRHPRLEEAADRQKGRRERQAVSTE